MDQPCVETNAQASDSLLYHCRWAKGFAFCSTGSYYRCQGQRPLTEDDLPGTPFAPLYNYSTSKAAAEAVPAGHSCHGGSQRSTVGGQLGRPRDGQCGGVLYLHGRTRWGWPTFEYSLDARTPLWPNVTRMHKVLGRTQLRWRERIRRMVKARHPDLCLADESG